MGHGAWGIGHGALIISPPASPAPPAPSSPPSPPSPHSPLPTPHSTEDR
ncbi:hypothetical protein H1Q63_14590 [Desmonostoc muscorum CCALA 125]|nr:hypothetical protein [Desmonostoc muscorum CCALA 125]